MYYVTSPMDSERATEAPLKGEKEKLLLIVSPGEELDVEEDVLPAVHESEALGCQQNFPHLGRRGAENDHCK